MSNSTLSRALQESAHNINPLIKLTTLINNLFATNNRNYFKLLKTSLCNEALSLTYLDCEQQSIKLINMFTIASNSSAVYRTQVTLANSNTYNITQVTFGYVPKPSTASEYS